MSRLALRSGNVYLCFVSFADDAVLFTAISHSFRLSVSFGKLCPDLLVHPDTQHRPLGIAIVVGTQYKSKIEVERDQRQGHYAYL